MPSSIAPIAHYENRYWINNTGQVLNLANNLPLTPSANPNGYLFVALADGKGGHIRTAIHRLVARHFLPNPYNHPQVNHRDGDKTHNHMSNLEWCSAQQNVEHALETGLRPGYMSADNKEKYLSEVLGGTSVGELAHRIGRRPETLSKMLRDTAKRVGVHDSWVATMKENRRAAAIRNLGKINN